MQFLRSTTHLCRTLLAGWYEPLHAQAQDRPVAALSNLQSAGHRRCRDPNEMTKNGSFAAFESTGGKDLYYSNISGLWRTPAAGGSEIRLSESIYGDNFAPTQQGV